MDSYHQSEDWPVQRLRIGWALILFFAFEMIVGQRLPPVLAYIVLSAGIALLASAAQSIRTLRSVQADPGTELAQRRADEPEDL